MTTILQMEQGTPEWLEWRRTKCTASHAAIIMGDQPDWSPVRTWADLRDVMAGFEPERKSSEYLDRVAALGLAAEDGARAAYMPNAKPCIAVLDDDDRFTASLDGFDVERRQWIEIKRPAHGVKSKMIKRLMEANGSDIKDFIMPHIYWQLVHQAAVLEGTAESCLFVAWVERPPDATMTLRIPTKELLVDWPILKEQWIRFLDGYPQGDVDHEWVELAMEYKSLKLNTDMHIAALKEVKDKLIAFGPRKGCGVAVIESTRKGTVDYNKAVNNLWEGSADELKKYLDMYRKPDTTSISIREVKE